MFLPVKEEAGLPSLGLILVTFFGKYLHWVICIVLASVQIHIGFVFVRGLSDFKGIVVMYVADIL